MKLEAVIFDCQGVLVDMYTGEASLGIKELLHFFEKNRIKTGIASNLSRAGIDRTLKEVGIEHKFDSISGIDTADFVYKPAPDVFLIAAQNMGAKPENCIGVDDSLDGIQAIISAGMEAVRFVNYETKSDRYTSVSSMSDLLSLINQRIK